MKTRRYISKLALALWLTSWPGFAQEQTAEEVTVTNRVMGGIEGLNNDTFSGGDGTGTGKIQLKVIRLRLHKQSHGLTEQGTMNSEPLKNDARVVLGQTLYFTLFVDNLTDAALYDLHLEDVLDEKAFAYIPGSLAMALTDAGRTAQEADFKQSLSDAEDSDIAAIADLLNDVEGPETLRIGSIDQKNGLVTLAPGKRLTIRFQVQVI